MEIESARKNHPNKLRYEKSPLRKLPMINKAQISKIKNLSWLKSLNSEKFQHSISAKATPANSIVRTKASQIRVDLEDLDQENRRLIQALNYVKTCNKELANIFSEERGLLETVLQKGEEMHAIDSGLRVEDKEVLQSDFQRKKKTPKKFKKQIILNQQTRQENSPAKLSLAFSTKRRSQSLVNNIFSHSQQDTPNSPRLKVKDSFEKGRKSLRVNEISCEINAFKMFKIDHKRFEMFVKQILVEEPHFFPDPLVLHRNISLLNLHLQDLERRINTKTKSQVLSKLRQVLAVNREMRAEVVRLKAHQTTVTQSALERFTAEKERLTRLNSEIKVEITELEELLTLADQSHLELEEEIRDRANFISEKERHYLGLFERNEALITEVAQHQRQIDELQVQIFGLNNS